MRANPAETFNFWVNRHMAAFDSAQRACEMGALSVACSFQAVQAEAFKKMERLREAVTAERR